MVRFASSRFSSALVSSQILKLVLMPQTARSASSSLRRVSSRSEVKALSFVTSISSRRPRKSTAAKPQEAPLRITESRSQSGQPSVVKQGFMVCLRCSRSRSSYGSARLRAFVATCRSPDNFRRFRVTRHHVEKRRKDGAKAPSTKRSARTIVVPRDFAGQDSPLRAIQGMST